MKKMKINHIKKPPTPPRDREIHLGGFSTHKK